VRDRGRYRWFADDIDASVVLGRVVARATGADLDRAVNSAVRRTILDLKHSIKMAPPGDVRLDRLTSDRRPRTRRSTPWRGADAKRIALRNALIVHALQHGFSRTQLGMVFELSRNQISNILAAFHARTEPAPEPES